MESVAQDASLIKSGFGMFPLQVKIQATYENLRRGMQHGVEHMDFLPSVSCIQT